MARAAEQTPKAFYSQPSVTIGIALKTPTAGSAQAAIADLIRCSRLPSRQLPSSQGGRVVKPPRAADEARAVGVHGLVAPKLRGSSGSVLHRADESLQRDRPDAANKSDNMKTLQDWEG
jgi:hypothetical protein